MVLNGHTRDYIDDLSADSNGPFPRIRADPATDDFASPGITAFSEVPRCEIQNGLICLP